MSTADLALSLALEAARQQALLAALWPAPGGTPQALATLSTHLDAQAAVPGARGLQAYRLNAGAVAERALSAAFPVLRAQLGAEAFAGFARACWHACPPVRGDLAEFVDAVPAFVSGDPQLADWPWLADLARLEAAIARAEGAGDDLLPREADLASLQRLAGSDPASLSMRFAPGACVVASAWPVAALWRAHGVDAVRHDGGVAEADERALDAVRASMAAGEGDRALVLRIEGRVQVRTIDAAEAALCAALLGGRDLAAALDAAMAAGPFEFGEWLARAVAEDLLREVVDHAPPDG